MDILTNLFSGRLLYLTLAGGAVALLLLLLEPALRKRLGVRWQYLSWLAPLVFFLLPLQLSVRPVPARVPTFQELPAVQLANYVMNTPIPAAVPEQASRLPSAYDLLALAWLAGALYFAGRAALSSARFHRALRRHSSPVDDQDTLALLAACMEEKGIRRGIPLLFCPLVGSPMLVGVLRPRILLPDTKLSREELRLVLLHELTHYKNGDLPVKLLALTVRVLHWFNPLAWMADRKLNALCELSCDAAMTRGMQTEERRAYGMAILSVMGQTWLAPPVSSAFSLQKDDLKKRLSLIMDGSRASKILLASGAAALAALVLLGVWIATYVRGGRDGSVTLIGGADGPTAIFSATKPVRDAAAPLASSPEQRLVDELLGSFAIATSTGDEPGDMEFIIPSTLPDGCSWSIHVAGRLDLGGGMTASAHWFDEPNVGWQAGRTYSDTFDPKSVLELNMTCRLADKDGKELASGTRTYIDTASTGPESRPADPPATREEALARQLTDSFEVVPDQMGVYLFSFTIPEGLPQGDQWRIALTGKSAGGKPLRWFDKETRSQSWVPGKRYTQSLDTTNTHPEVTLTCEILDSNKESLVNISHTVMPPTEATLDHDGLESELTPAPFQWPSADAFIAAQLFDGNTSMGIDLTGSDKDGKDVAGSMVLASESGTVSFVGSNSEYGKYLILNHGNSYQTLYANCNTIIVKEKEIVTTGQAIATLGRSEAAGRYQLHFEIRVNGSPVDPISLLGVPAKAGDSEPAEVQLPVSLPKGYIKPFTMTILQDNNLGTMALVDPAKTNLWNPTVSGFGKSTVSVLADGIKYQTYEVDFTSGQYRLLYEAKDLVQQKLDLRLIEPVEDAEIGVKFFGYYGHTGIDLHKSGIMGAEIRAAADGNVIFTKQSAVGYGNHIIIDHGNGIQTLYAQCDELKITLPEDGKPVPVKTGDVIATVGRTGNATGPHLHFELRVNGVPIDPTPYLYLYFRF